MAKYYLDKIDTEDFSDEYFKLKYWIYKEIAGFSIEYLINILLQIYYPELREI